MIIVWLVAFWQGLFSFQFYIQQLWNCWCYSCLWRWFSPTAQVWFHPPINIVKMIGSCMGTWAGSTRLCSSLCSLYRFTILQYCIVIVSYCIIRWCSIAVVQYVTFQFNACFILETKIQLLTMTKVKRHEANWAIIFNGQSHFWFVLQYNII